MQIEFTGRPAQIPARLPAPAERRRRGSTPAHIVLSGDKPRQERKREAARAALAPRRA